MSKEQLSTSKKEVPKLRNALEEKYKEQKVESVEEVKRVDETNVGSIKDELPVPTYTYIFPCCQRLQQSYCHLYFDKVVLTFFVF